MSGPDPQRRQTRPQGRGGVLPRVIHNREQGGASPLFPDPPQSSEDQLEPHLTSNSPREKGVKHEGTTNARTDDSSPRKSFSAGSKTLGLAAPQGLGNTKAVPSPSGTGSKEDHESARHLPQRLEPMRLNASSVNAVAFSPDGKTVASASWDKTIRLWDATTGDYRQELEGHDGSVYAVAFSPDGKTVASGSLDRTVRLWDAATGEERQKLQGHGSRVSAVAFSPDGRTVASGSRDKTVRLWDAVTGKKRQKLQGHDGLVSAVAFSPDGRTVASGSLDETVRLRDAATGEDRQKPEGHFPSPSEFAQCLLKEAVGHGAGRTPRANDRSSLETLVKAFVMSCKDGPEPFSDTDAFYYIKMFPIHAKGLEASVLEELVSYQDKSTSICDIISEVELPMKITESIHWQWLVARLATHLSSQLWNGTISSSIVNTPSMQLHPLINATFRTQWDIQSFLSQQFSAHLPPSFDDIIVVVGDGQETYACTCLQYARRYWPVTGPGLLAVLDRVNSPAHKPHTEYELLHEDHNTKITIDLSEGSFVARARIPLTILIDLCELFAWLGAPCTTAPFDFRNCLKRPRVKIDGPSPAYATVIITYELEELPTANEGSCWRPLFCNASIADGFPIPSRTGRMHGLEAPFDIMCALAETDMATTHDNKFMLKGFSSMLVPVVKEASAIVWHFRFDNTQNRLCYSAAEASCITEHEYSSRGLDRIKSMRHIIAWIPDAMLLTGTKEATYFNIAEPGCTDTLSNLVLERATITAGKFVNLGASIGRGRHMQALWACGSSSLGRRLEYARQMNIVLFDTKERRGYLVDGTSAIMHLAYAQLKSGMPGEHPMLDSLRHASTSPDGCKLALLAPVNQSIVLREEMAESYTEITVSEIGKRTEVRKTKMQSWCFRDLVLELWEIMEKVWEHQLSPPSGIDLRCTDRDRLEGWSFKSIVDKVPCLAPRTLHLKSSGRGWVDLIRTLPAVTLMGRGFGDLIRPSNAEVLCEPWHSVPTGRDYLAVPMHLLEEITSHQGDLDRFPQMITKELHWHQPDKLFQECPPASSCYKESLGWRCCERVQVLLPWSIGTCNKPSDLCQRVNRSLTGAIIVGHAERFPWHWPKVGLPGKGKSKKSPTDKALQSHKQSEQGSARFEPEGEQADPTDDLTPIVATEQQPDLGNGITQEPTKQAEFLAMKGSRAETALQSLPSWEGKRTFVKHVDLHTAPRPPPRMPEDGNTRTITDSTSRTPSGSNTFFDHERLECEGRQHISKAEGKKPRYLNAAAPPPPQRTSKAEENKMRYLNTAAPPSPPGSYTDDSGDSDDATFSSMARNGSLMRTW